MKMGSIDFDLGKSMTENRIEEETEEDHLHLGMVNEAFEYGDGTKNDISADDGNNNKGAGEKESGGRRPTRTSSSSMANSVAQRRRSSVEVIRQSRPYRQLSRVLSTSFYQHSLTYTMEGMTQTVNICLFPL